MLEEDVKALEEMYPQGEKVLLMTLTLIIETYIVDRILHNILFLSC